MANNQFNLSFVTDLDRGITLTPLRNVFIEDDHQAHVFIVKAVRGGAAVPLAGATVKGYFIPYGMEIAVQLPGSVDASGAASVSLTRDCYAFLGRFNLVIQTTIDGVDSSIFYGEGYVTRTRTDKVIEPSGAVPSLGTLEQMIKNLTYADVGAAPAGYGLGGEPKRVNNCDEATKSGWYIAPYPNETGYVVGVTGVMRVDAYSDTFFTQTFYAPMGNAYDTVYVLIRQFNGATFTPWEWDNPPMALGVEYRTTERHNGAVVYAKAINFGTLPSGGYKDVAHGIDTKTMNVRFEIVGGNTNLMLQPNPNITSVIINSTIIQIATSASVGAYDAVVKLWYTK